MDYVVVAIAPVV